MKQSSNYEAFIDGIRAVAVLAILFFHLDFPGWDGGFVGVDIFFVISGYLITGNIFRQLQAGTFSLGNFYQRRARRILPALFVTLLLTFLCSVFVLSPSDLESFSKSMMAAGLFIANIYFWTQSGYFTTASENNLLLHTWSLSLEEQFYLLWPFVLLLVWRLKHFSNLLPILALTGVLVPIFLGDLVAENEPEAAFFLLPFRIHEFAIGAICYWWTVKNQQIERKFLADVIFALGTLLVTCAILFLDAGIRYPGYASILPAAGTALLLVGAKSSRFSPLLANSLTRLIGLSSYSIYLVHWPVIVIYRYITPGEWSVNEQVGLFFSSIVLGLISWKFVEQPFRATAYSENGPRIWKPFIAVGFGAVAILALSTIRQDGWPQRFPDAFYMTQGQLYKERERYWQGFGKNEYSNLQLSDNPDFLLVIGNSHAQDLVYALRQNGFEGNIKYLGVSYKCFNFGVGVEKGDQESCSKRRSEILKSPSLQRAKRIYLHEDFKGDWINDLSQFLSQLRSRTSAPIYLLGPRLIYKESVLKLAQDHRRMSGLGAYALEHSYLAERSALSDKLNNYFDSRGLDQWNIFYVDMLGIQCGVSLDECGIISESTSEFLYFDKSHFTIRGAKEFGAKLKSSMPGLFQWYRPE